MKSFLFAMMLCLIGPVMAQEHEAVRADAGQQGTDRQIQENTARLDVQEKMTGNQDFILKLLGILVPAVVLLMQWRLSKQVNGMKHELVEEVRKAALLQGAKNERERPKKITTRKKRAV